MEGMSAANSPHTQTRLATWVGIGLVILFAAIYLLTLDNGLQPEELSGGDLITHQYAQVQARPANAPGYPLYTMGGWLWYQTAHASANLFGASSPNPIPLLSSYSTLWALLSLWLLYQIVRFITGTRYRPDSSHGWAGNWILAALIASFYGVTYFFWYYATTTEQYSSAIAQTLAIFYIYLLWSEEAGESAHPPPAETRNERRADWLLVALALLSGISLAHMLTVAFIVPPLIAVILWQRPDYLRRGWLILACVVAAALPLLSYTYIYVRGAAHPEWWGSVPYANASEWFWAFVRTSQGFQELGWGSEAGRTFFGNGFPELIWQELSIPLLVFGLIGVALLKRRTAWLIYGTTVVYLIFCWMYRYGNWYQVILPLYPLLLIGVATIFERVLQWQPLRAKPILSAIPYLLLVVAIGWRAWASLPDANSRNRVDDTALARASVLLGTAADRAALFATVDDALALDYLVNIWRLAGDHQVVSSEQAADVAHVRPLLATWESAPTLLAEIGADEMRVEPFSADWVEVLAASGTPLSQVETHNLLEAPVPFGNGDVLLQSVSTATAPLGAPVSLAPAALDVELAWKLARGEWPDYLAYSVRPTLGGANIALGGDVISQYDSGHPMQGLLGDAYDPTSPRDYFRLPLNQPLPQGADGLQLIIYRSDTGEVIQEVNLVIQQAQPS